MNKNSYSDWSQAEIEFMFGKSHLDKFSDN